MMRAISTVDGEVVYDSGDTPEGRNRAAIEAAVESHMADLAAIANSTGTLTGAQLSNAVRVLARGQRRLIRLTVGLLDATD